MDRRADDVTENLGDLQRAWRWVGNAAKEAWDAMLDIGREDTSADQIADLKGKINDLARSMAPDASFWEKNTLLGKLPEAQKVRLIKEWRQQVRDIRDAGQQEARAAEERQRQQDAQDAGIALEERARQYRDNATKLAAEMASAQQQLNQALSQFGGRDATQLAGRELEEYNRIIEAHGLVVKGLAEKYKDKNKAASGRDTTQAIRDQAAMELAMLQTQTRQVQAQYELREISVEDYYSKLMELARQERDVQLRSNEAQIAALAGMKDEQRQVSQLRAASARAEQQYAQATIDLETRKTQAVRAFQNQQRAFDDSLADRTRNLQREMQDMAASVGMGDRQAEIARRITDLYREQADQIEEINRAVRDGSMLTEEGERRIQKIREETINQLEVIRQGYRNREEAEANWINGAVRGFENLKIEASGYADLFDQGVTTGINGATDAIVEFSRTGEFSLDSLGKSVAELVTRFLVLRAIMSGLNAAFPQYTAFGQANGIGAPIQVGGQTFAKGGVPGTPGLSAYVNKIVDRPTFFAKGGVPNNVMGEAGTEGIFPLKRDSQGRLGVIATGSANGKVTVNIHGAPSQPQVQTREQGGETIVDVLFDQFESRMGHRISQGAGPVYSGITSRLNVKER